MLKNILNTLKLGGKSLFLHLEIQLTSKLGAIFLMMKKHIFLLFGFVLLMCSCAAEFNRVYKTTDYAYKYEYAKECFARGKYSQAISLLQELVTIMKVTDNGEECL